ncbi:MAG: S8 family serine peptidase [Euryarchaeota archaeon]|nr:S8 family serine peptidase [Euryarchaeota archaeon]
MNHKAMIAILVCLAFVGVTIPTGAADPLDPLTEKQPYIVGFYELPEDRRQYGGDPVKSVNERLSFFVVETKNPTLLEIRGTLDERVRYIEKDHTDWHLNYVPSDARYGDMYGPQITNTEAAWDVTLGSTSVKLGLLDSGITIAHEDFVNSRVSGWDYKNGDSSIEDHSGCSYHGTHTAGTAAATTDNGVGVAGMSQSSIIMHKIFHSGIFGCGGATTSAIADALADMGDKGAHISSNSWGGGSSTALSDGITYAHNKGVIHVAAAGNDGSCTNCISSPWKENANKVVIVTSSTSTDSFSSFSSQGPEADIIAPGSNILSVDGGTTTGYKQLSGTSMATPHVAGAVGLYVAANGDASFSTIEGALKSSADDIGLSADRQGAGRLNTGNFVGGGGGGGGTNSPPTASFTAGCNDLACSFDGSGSTDTDGTISSYAWDFGDGTTGSGATVSHTYAAGGTYTVTLTVTDDGGATDSDSKSVTVSSGTSSSLHSEDFEDGAANGYTKSSGSNDLWRLSSDCVTPAGGIYQIAFSRAAPNCDYDVGTAVGWAATPTVDASAFGTVTLEFDHYWQTESYNGAYDKMSVQVSSDGGASWSTVLYKDARDDNPAGWLHESIDVSSFGTANLKVRYHFDSVDGLSNDFAGWYVDNIVVTGS